MAAYYTTRPSFVLQVVAGRVGAVLSTVYNAVVDWNDARVTRNALSNLTDRELEDIGLVRGDIDIVAETNRLL